MDGQQIAGRAAHDPGGPADQRRALRPAGERDHDPFAGLPHPADAVLVPVLAQRLVHPARHPQQRQLAQRGEVPEPEVARECRVDLLRRVDVAVRHTAPQPLGRQVDQFDLVGTADEFVGHGLVLRHTGDLLDHIAERVQVLDVERGRDVDPGGEQFLDVPPPFGVPAARGVGVREFVDEHHLRAQLQRPVQVDLGEVRTAMAARHLRQDVQPVEHGLGGRAAVTLREGHHHSRTAGGPAPAFVQHPVGLAHPGSSPEKNLEPAGARPRSVGRIAAPPHHVLLHVPLFKKAARRAP